MDSVRENTSSVHTGSETNSVNKVNLFSKKIRRDEDLFDVPFEQTQIEKNLEEPNVTTVFEPEDNLLGRVALFKRRKTNGQEDTFRIEYEDSHIQKDLDESNNVGDVEVSLNGRSSVHQTAIFKKRKNLRKKDSLFNITYEESQIGKSPGINNSRQRIALFKKRGTKGNDDIFDIECEESQNTDNFKEADTSIESINLSVDEPELSSINVHKLEDILSSKIPSTIPVKEKQLPLNNIENIIDWELKFKEIVEKAERKENIKKKCQPKLIEKKILPSKKHLKKSSKPKLKKPAPYVTKRLYKFLINKLEPEYGIDATICAEELVVRICETVKIVTRRKTYQKKLINDLKIEMAKLKIIETTWDFYDFIRDFLLDSFRHKSIPHIQPVTCEIWPPRDCPNPFDKIL